MNMRMAAAVLIVTVTARTGNGATMSKERYEPGAGLDAAVPDLAPESMEGPARSEHRIKLVGTSNPEPVCGSAIECSRMTATIDAPCRWNPSSRAFIADGRLVTIGAIYYFNGPIGRFSPFSKVSSVDSTVTSGAEARRHAFEWHINLAVDYVLPLVEQLANHPFSTRESCEEGSAAVRNEVTRSFLRRLRETQQAEEAFRKDPRVAPSALVLPPLAAVLPEENGIALARGRAAQ